MRRRKLIKQAAVTGTLGSVALAGCLGDDDGNGEGTPDDWEVEMGNWPDLSGQEVLVLTEETSEPAQNIFNQVASDFEDETGGDVTVEFHGFDDMPQRISQLIQAENYPEVFHIGQSDGPEFVSNELLASLDDVIEEFVNVYGDLPEQQRVIVDDNDYLAPLFVDTHMNWYREDIVSEPVPATWDTHLEAAASAHGVQDLAGTYNGAGTSVCTSIEMLAWGYSNGARTVEWQDDEVVSIINEGQNRDRWIEVVEYLQELHEYSAPAADGGCTEMINAIPDRVAAVSPYYGARPKGQAIARERDFAGDIRAAHFPSNRQQGIYGQAEGWSTFSGSNVTAGRAFILFSLQPEYYMPILQDVAPLHHLPPGQAVEHEEYQRWLDEDIPDAWSDRDLEINFERLEFVNHPTFETDPPNQYTGAWSDPTMAEMKFEAVVEQRPADEIVDEFSDRVDDLLQQAQR